MYGYVVQHLFKIKLVCFRINSHLCEDAFTEIVG